MLRNKLVNKISEDLLKLGSLFGIQLQLDVHELIIFKHVS